MDQTSLKKKLEFIESYKAASNAATGSKYDSNANVTQKNIATLQCELGKKDIIEVRRAIMREYLTKLYGIETADQYLADLDQHIIYQHDETTIYPYTYSSKEVVNVKYGDQLLLVSMDQLYSLVDTEEVLLDEQKEVYAKFPLGLQILDRNGWTTVRRLIRKRRHRDLVRVETTFGEDLIVTDNHPLIVSDDINNTIEAQYGAELGGQQFKLNRPLEWNVHSTIFVIEPEETHNIDLTFELGYFVGLFIGNGTPLGSGDDDCVRITHKNQLILDRLSDIVSRHMKISSIALSRKNNDEFELCIYSSVLTALLALLGGRSDVPDNSLPINILETNKEFASGVIYGVVDSNGLVNQGLLMRTCANQLRWLSQDLGLSDCADGWGNIVGVNKIESGPFLSELNEYIYDITTDSHSFICNNLWVHNCAAISIYPFLLDGLKTLGGSSGAPQHANSFIGGIINLIFMCASQLAGALAIPEFFCAFDYYLRKDYGPDYPQHWDETIDSWGTRNSTLRTRIYDWFQQFVYSVNQPAGARNYQSPFINVAYFDKYYFASIFKDYVFPDGDEPCWETTKELQKLFMVWFNEERTRSILTFPVETANLLVTNKQYADEETADFVADMWAKGHSFFVYQSDSVDALASCCFSKDQLVRIRVEGQEIVAPFVEVYSLYAGQDLEIYHLGRWARGVVVRQPNRPMYRIRLANGATLTASDNHLHLSAGGDVPTTELRVGDVLICFDPDATDPNQNTKAVNIVDIQRVQYDGDIYCFVMTDTKNPYFTLANGVVTHNCRLRNEVNDNTFSYTLGAGGVKTGSKSVITLNLNRIIQDWYNQASSAEKLVGVGPYIEKITKRVHQYLNAWDAKLWDDFDAGMLPMYTQGFIDLDKQYLTCGINGFVEAAEFLAQQQDTCYSDICVSPTSKSYQLLARDILGTIKRVNIADRTEKLRYNTEFVPAENLAGKFYNWDKADGYVVPQGRVLYNSYFYRVEDPTVDPVSKFFYQGTGFATECDGGVALHNNLSEHLTKAQYRKLMDVAVQAGCNYWTFNIPNTICNDCEHIDKRMLTVCPKCGSTNLDYATRIIGYLKRVSNFSELRQAEEKMRYYGGASSVKLVDSETEER